MSEIEGSEIFFDKNPIPMWIFEPDTLEIVAVNDAAPAVYGYTKEEMLSLTLRDLRPESEVGKLEEEVGKDIQELNDSGIWLHRKKNGDSIHMRILSYPVEWEGSVSKLVVAQNVSSQVQASGELKAAEAKLQILYSREKWKRLRIQQINSRLQLLENVGNLFAGEVRTGDALNGLAQLLVKEVADICAIDLIEEGTPVRVAQEIISGKRDIVHEIRSRSPEFFQNHSILKKVIESGQPLLKKNIPEKDLRSLVPDEEQFERILRLGIKSFFILPLKVNRGVIGVLTLVITEGQRNFTEDDPGFFTELASKTALNIENKLINDQLREFNRTLETRIRERTRQLEQMNDELESFSYSVSHDLRTPLRAIGGYTNLLIEDYYEQMDEDGRNFLSVIKSEAARMGELIDDLLSFSRLSRKEKVRQRFSMDQLVRESIGEVLQAWPANDPEFDVQPLGEITGDPMLLRQVWVNLIHNAVKYQKEGNRPRIGIGSRREDSDTVFFIRDNGVGFNMKYADKLFGVFQRLHGDDEFEGTGIGLALVRRIVNRHGGEVHAESEPGKGSTFSFSLPETKPEKQ